MITKNETRTKVWNYLINTLKMNEYGAAGFMGNLHAESGVCANCVESLLIQRYGEDSRKYNTPYIKGYKRPVNTAANISYNSQRYTRLIDTGAISKDEFLHPRSYTGKKHQYGYGAWQVTSEGRKARLWANTVAKGKSIADINGQLQTLRQELTGAYKNILKVCQTAKSVDEASDYVLIHFEAPANAESMKATRREYGKEYYTLYHVNTVKQEEKGGMNMSYDVNKVISIAQTEVGYTQKKSNSQLDSKTANAGSGNFVKYWRDLYPSYQGQSYCDCFVKWCMYKAYGKDAANTLTCGGLYSFYTPSSAQLYKNKGQWHTGSDVRRGDQIFFKNSQRIHHTGLVVDVKNGRVYTVQGNTSNGTAVVPNGGMVCAKSYPIGLSKIAGYGRPNYGAQSIAKPSTPAAPKSTAFDYRSIYDDVYYKKKYPDVAKAYGAKDAYEHFVTYGLKQERSSCAKFDPKFYKAHNPDVAKYAGSNSAKLYQHYVNYVMNGTESRKGSAADGGKFIATVTADALNVRTTPEAKADGSNKAEFGPLAKGTQVTVANEFNGWYYINVTDKNKVRHHGFVAAKYMKRK